jgi:rhomboid protease GluP
MSATNIQPPDDGVAAFRLALFAQTPRVWATPLLVAINVAVFVAMVATGVSPFSPTVDGLIRWGADYAPRTTAGEWWRLVTNTFIHIGIVHIGMNMIGLWQIGALVERLLGHRSFLVVYLFAGLCGSLASITWHPFVVSAGASGAVFGVYGVLIAYLVRHRGSIPRPVLLSLQKSTVFFIGLNVAFGLQQKGIDMAAHTGGLLGGFVAALLVARPLTVHPPRRTVGRDLILVVAGLGLFVAAVMLVPRAVDIPKEMTDLQTMEQQAVKTYNGALEQRQASQISDVELARIVDEKVLPNWRQYRRHLRTLGHLPPQEAKRVDEIGRYMDLREKGWTAFSQALRANDDAKASESKRFQQQADSLLKTIGGTGD